MAQRAKHETDLFTGSFVYSVPIEGPPARNGSEPHPSLVYSSSGENGWCGVGWNLDVGYIERYTKDGIPIKWDTSSPPLPIKQYDDSKGFLCSLFGRQLRLLLYSGNEYRAEVDTDFTRFIFDPTNNRWDVYDKSGNLFRFGYSYRVINTDAGWTANSTGTFRWALDQIITVTGDQTTITYQTHSTTDPGTARVLYPNLISYNGHTSMNGYGAAQTPTHTIQFQIEARTDKRISYRSGFRVVQDMRINIVTCKAGTQFVRRYDLGYDYSPSSKRSLLKRLTVNGYALNSSTPVPLPTQTFEYQEKPLSFQQPTTTWTGMNIPDVNFAGWKVVAGNDTTYGAMVTDLVDIDGDGLPDRVRMNRLSPWNNFWVQRNNGNGAFSTDYNWGPTASQGNINDESWSAIDSAHTRFVDVTGDGRPDRVMDDKNRLGGQDPINFVVEQNTGTGFSADTTWAGINSQAGQVWQVEASGWVRMIDINGDGRPDRVSLKNAVPQAQNYFLVELGTGTGFAPVKRFGPYTSQGQTSNWEWVKIDSSYVKFIDINGDGLPDRVMLPVSTTFPGFPVQDATLNKFVVEFNNGYSFEQAASTDWTGVDPQYNGVPAVIFPWVERFPGVGLFDINGDGLPDRVMYKYADSTHTTWFVQLNNGSGFEPVALLTGIDNQGQNSDKWYGINGTDDCCNNALTEMIDINGDGLVDRIMTDFTSYSGGATFNGFKVQLSSGPFPDLLKTVNNGIGGSITTEYKPSTAWDNRKDTANPDSERLLPYPIQTATTVSEVDGINLSRATTYAYEGGFYDPARREFSGFARVTVTDPPPSNRYKVFWFHQGGGRDYASSGEYQDVVSGVGNFAKKGTAYRIETYGNDTPTPLLYNAIVNQVDQTDLGGGRRFPFVKQSFSFDYPGGGTAKTTATKFVYDSATGNLTKKVLYGEVSGASLTGFTFADVNAADTQYHQISYAPITGNSYIKDHPDTVSLTSDDAGAQVLQQTKYTYYANNDSVNTEQKRLCPGSFAVETYQFDSYGRRNLTTAVTAVQTYVETFDSTYQIYPTSTRERVTANVNSAADHVTATAYDARSGSLLTLTDPMGVQIANTYDEFLRLKQTDKTPFGGSLFWVKKIDYNLGGISSGISANYVRIRNIDGIDTVNGIEAWAYTDGFARVVEARTEAEQTGSFGFRVVNTVYDERGEIFLVTWPRFESGSAYTKPPASPTPVPALFTGFDPAGRASEKRQRVDATFDSAGKYLSKTDSAGDTYSPLGARSWQYKNGTDPWWIVATDEEGKIRRYRLDGFGRTNRIEEVDGANTYATTLNYDLSGNLIEIINNNAEHIYYGYDEAGNMVAMADPHLGQWKYKHDVAGRLREQTDAKGQKITFEYNAPLSRLSAKKVYNKSGQLVSTATYTYDTSDDVNYTVYKGLLYKVTDAEGSEKNDYDTRGRLRKTTRHLNVKNQDYTTTYAYNDGDRVTSIVYPNSGPTINYSYHPSGSLYQVYRTGYTYYQATAASFDAFSHVTQFSYGSGTVNNRGYFPVSQRLQTITTSGILSKDYRYNKADDVTYISGASITYDDLHRIKTYTGLTGSYAYDSVGNITTSIEGGGSAYAYGNARKQAVKTAFGKTYLYDLCGNMIVRGAQALDYDSENHLVRLSQPGTVVAEYGYAADGTRLWKRKNQTELQVWIGKFYEEKQGKTLFHVFAGDQRVCTFEPGSVLAGGSGGASTHVGYYYHQDHLNSSSALSGSSAQLLEGNTWYAFGSVQAATPQASFQVSGRFTGQVLDAETGLYYYNARYYDPGLGRFIQADTIIPDLANPQSYNRYSYVANNPLRYVDPTGHGLLDWIGSLFSYSGPTYLGPEPGAQPSNGPPLAAQYDEIHSYVGNLHPNAVATWSSGRSMAFEDSGRIATTFRDEVGKELAIGAVASGVGKFAKAGEAAVGERAAGKIVNTEARLLQHSAGGTTKAIALGKDIPGGGMKALAEKTGSSWYRNWARDGITRRTVDKNFGRAFHEAVERADVIHFALDGINDVNAAVRAGAAGFKQGNFTQAELHYIANNPGLLEKTIFYRGSEVVPSPF